MKNVLGRTPERITQKYYSTSDGKYSLCTVREFTSKRYPKKTYVKRAAVSGRTANNLN